jgi:hypothetical protein
MDRRYLINIAENYGGGPPGRDHRRRALRSRAMPSKKSLSRS